MIFLSTLLISMFITIALIPFFRGLAMKVNALDVPNDRKIHKYPMPNSGGIAMALGSFNAMAALFSLGDPPSSRKVRTVSIGRQRLGDTQLELERF